MRLERIDMRTVLAVIVSILLLTGAYYVLSFLIDREPVRLRREILELSERLQVVEEFMKREALKEQAAATGEIGIDAAKIQRIAFNAALANIRVHILKVKIDLMLKNTAIAKSELAIIDEALQRAKTLAAGEDVKTVEEIQSTLKKAITLIDIDLPAASSNVEVLWHQLTNQLMRSEGVR
jgi:hypothetical protein